MAEPMNGLEFQIETTVDDSAKGIDALAKSLGSLKKATKGGLGLGSTVKQLKTLNNALKGFHTEKLEGLGKALESVSNLGNVKISGSLAKSLGSIVDVAKRIDWSDVEKIEDMTKALHDLGAVSNIKMPKITTPTAAGGTAPITGTEVVGSGVTPTTSGVESVAAGVQQASSAVDQVTAKTSVLKRVLSGIGGVFGKAFSLGTGALHKLGNSITKVKELASKAKTSMISFRKSLGAGLAARIKQTTSGLGQMFSSLKRIAMYRLIRFFLSQLTKALKEGINNLYQYSNLMGGTFAHSMDTLATSANYLKNSLGAMAAPIINSLAPAIDFVIDKIVTLLNYINMLFARLSGASTFTAAKKNATSYGAALEGAGGSAADAAKKIKDATTGIDELNIIMERDDASGGGGGGGADYGSMFEELPIDNQLSDFVDKLKQAFDNADWKTLGTLLGEKVNELIDSIDYEGIGHKLGFGINGAIQTAYYFLKTVDFYNIGKHLAELLNAALSEVDTSFIGRLIIRWFTMGIDLVLGFIGELDWGQLARKVSDCVKGAFDEATEWLKSYDWSQLGKDLWQGIKDVVSNIDWGGIATSLFTFLGTAIRSAAQFLGGFFGSIGKDIKKWWDEEIKGENWKETAGNLLSAIGEGFVNIGEWVIINIAYPFLDALTGGYFSEQVELAGGDIVEGFLNGIWEAIKGIGRWIKTNIVDPFVKWFKDLFGIHSPSTVMKAIGGSVVDGFLEGILAPFKAIGTWVKKNIVDPLVDAFDESSLAEFTVGVKNTATEWWENVNKWWNNKVGAVKTFTTNVSNQATTWWNNTKSWWSGKVGAVKNFTTSVTNQASQWWENVKSWWSGKVGAVQQFTTSVKNEASVWWENVKSWWSGKVGAVQQFTTSLKNDSLTWWNNCKSWWSGKVGAVQQFTTSVKNDANTWWSNVKTWWSGVVGNLSVSVAIKNEATTWWNNVKSWWNNAVGTLTTTLNIKIPKISIKWSEVTALGQTFRYPSGFNLTWNAMGGILDGAQIFGMMGNTLLGGGEAGREAVLPLDTHTEWMDTLAQKVRDGLPDESGSAGYAGFKRAMADFYVEYVQGTVNQMANDMNRQANKKEQTNVQIGSRVITDTVKTQQDANGYQFIT